MHGGEGGSTGVDDIDNIGAWILGCNMFGPVRGEWPNDEWKGWWGEEPPYHVPGFVLTHHRREPIQMAGGTTFHFVTEGMGAALSRARQAAVGRDVGPNNRGMGTTGGAHALPGLAAQEPGPVAPAQGP